MQTLKNKHRETQIDGQSLAGPGPDWRNSGRWLLVALCLATAGMLPLPARGAETGTVVTVAILEKGRPETTAAIASIRHNADAQARELRAAAELARCFREMTGIALPVQATNAVAQGAGSIWVGQVAVQQGWISKKELADCGPDGFVIKTGPYGIAIAGGSPKGTLYGAYRLLEDMGVQFFSGRIPKASRPTLPYAFKKDRPFFDLRTICQETYGSGSLDDELGDPRPLADKSLEPLWLDHTQGFLVPLNRYWKEHPEYYAQGDWRKALPASIGIPKVNRVWLCMSNPDARRIAGDTLLEWIKQQPDKRFFSVHGGDSDTYCRCTNCMAVGNLSDNLVAFANVLAKRVKAGYPEKRLLIFAYQVTLDAPQKMKPAENVIVLFAPYGPPHVKSRIHSFLSGPMNSLARESFDRWYAMAPKSMGTYEYNFSTYLPSLDKMITQIKEYGQRDMRGIFYCGNTSMMLELFLYMNAKLLWDPAQDDKKLIRDFCDGFYGAAGPSMTELVQLIRTQVRAPGVSFPPYVDESGVLTSEATRRKTLEQEMGKTFYTPEFRSKAAALLDKAEQAVSKDPGLVQRVRTVREQFAGIL